MRRVVADVAPRYVFAENVSIKAIEQAATELCSMDFKAELLTLSAKDLGADHIRERHWLLAYTDDKSELRRIVNAEVAKFKEFRDRLWQTDPEQSGMDDGLASRVERYEATGNGQVSIVAAAALWSLANA